MAKSRDCKHSYINYSTGTIHCHKKNGGACVPENCTNYRKNLEEYIGETQESNERRIERMRGN